MPTSTKTQSSSKQILLPFGEYLPLEKEFPWLRIIFPEAGNYEIENQLTLLPYTLKKDYAYNPKKNFSIESIQMINSPELILQNLADEKELEQRNFLGLICYEAMYTNLVWDFFRQHKDIDFIINSTNDSWFGNYLENYQHDSVVKLRGVEFGRYFIRATLNGVTTSYNHLGEEIIPPSIIDAKTFRLVDAKVLKEKTFYAEYGSILTWIMSFLLLVLQYSTSKKSRRV